MSDGTDDRPVGPSGPPPRLDHLAIALLGAVTIAAYGSWYYAFGVLLDPIRADTGWGESLLATSFSVGVVVIGVVSVAGGRLLDRLGSRTLFIIGGIGGGGALLLTSVAPGPLTFALAAAAAMGLLGGTGFYHATMTCAVRLNPERSARAIAVLTIWGAFASAIYLPLTALLVDRLGWRGAVRVLAAITVVVFLSAAAVLRPVRSDDGGPTVPLRRVLAATVDRPQRRAFTASIALGWIGMSTILVYQVPVMTAAGLPLATAATLAGLRGVAQTAGRVPLGPIVERLGSARSVSLAFASVAVGGLLLAVSGHPIPALGFALTAGFGIGALSPLQGIVVEELYDRRTLGATMGSYTLIGMGSGALGPVLAGILVDATGNRRLVTSIVVVTAMVAAVLALRIRPDGRDSIPEVG